MSTTQREIQLKGRKVKYRLTRHPRAKRIRVTVHNGGEVTVTTPRRGRFRHAMIARSFLYQKADWLLRNIDYFRRFSPYRVAIPKKNSRFKEETRERAYRLIERRIEYYNDFYRLRYNNIYVKDHRRQWGSCSEKRNLNFNLRIALLPRRLADYIIVHEMCHLREFNHSKRFWNLIARTLPDYEKRRQELKAYRLG